MIRSAIRHTTQFVVKAGAARASRAGAAVLLLVGCATVGAGPAPTGREICVPPGLPPVTQWIIQASKPVFMEDAEHRPVMVVQSLYAIAGRPVGAYWLNGAILSVDTDPTDQTAAVLYDWGLMDALGRLRADGKPYCEWKPVAHSETTRLRTETARN